MSSHEYSPVSTDPDGNPDPYAPPPHARSSTKQWLIIAAVVLVCGYLAVAIFEVSPAQLLFSRTEATDTGHSFAPNARSGSSDQCTDAPLTADQRIDALLYREFKVALQSGDETLAQEIAVQLVRSYTEAATTTNTTVTSTQTPISQRPAGGSTLDPTKIDPVRKEADYVTSLDVIIGHIVYNHTLAFWDKVYKSEERTANKMIRRDKWHIGGTFAFSGDGCIPLSEQCSAENAEAAEALCLRHKECLGFVCNKGRTDCQLRVAPLQHNQQDNYISYYKNAYALALAETRHKEQKNRDNSMMAPGSTAAADFNWDGVCGKDGYKCVISYGLYGSNPKYGEGAIENAKLLDTQFPGWMIRIYHDNTVPPSLLKRLEEHGCELSPVDQNVQKGDIAGMFWRFLVAEDSTVDRYIVRDTDSRLNPREKAAVDEWLTSGYSIHTIRDHPNHDRPMNGGMWGGTKGSLTNIRSLIQTSVRNGYGADLSFLCDKVWPLIQYDQIGHDSYSCHKYINSFPFPIKRPDDFQHVGQVFENNQPRMGDITCCLVNNPAPMECRKDPSWTFG